MRPLPHVLLTAPEMAFLTYRCAEPQQVPVATQLLGRCREILGQQGSLQTDGRMVRDPF